jgi:hypothetical protein
LVPGKFEWNVSWNPSDINELHVHVLV